ncbi:rCG24373 [Rattus norvegicus]|uniref:RCG24373 n=1 Tax=Rattus norvegicus TaxID=10116 RepID=A6K5F4_RAT|nr:rCG24373 [Rattus norvegicus]
MSGVTSLSIQLSVFLLQRKAKLLIPAGNSSQIQRHFKIGTDLLHILNVVWLVENIA